MIEARKNKYKKYIIYCLLILLAQLLQNVSGLFPEIFGARCFLVIPTVLILSVGEDELSSAFLGLFAGLVWDITSAVHRGFNFIFFALACFLISSLVNTIIRDTFITNMIVCFVGAILYSLTYWLLFIVITGNGSIETIFSFYLPSTLYTIVASFFIYLIFKPIKNKLNS